MCVCYTPIYLVFLVISGVRRRSLVVYIRVYTSCMVVIGSIFS